MIDFTNVFLRENSTVSPKFNAARWSEGSQHDPCLYNRALRGLDHTGNNFTGLRAGRTRVKCETLTIAPIRTKVSPRVTLTGCPDHHRSDQKLQLSRSYRDASVINFSTISAPVLGVRKFDQFMLILVLARQPLSRTAMMPLNPYGGKITIEYGELGGS